jgi:hypothetical protein
LAGGEYAAGIARTAAIDTGFILVLQAVGASGRVGTSVRLRFGIGVRASRARGVVGAGYDKWDQKKVSQCLCIFQKYRCGRNR